MEINGKRVIAFENNNEGAVSHSIRMSNGGTFRILLWRKGEKILDREGNPVVIPELNHPFIQKLGIMPVFAKETVVKSPFPGTVVNKPVVKEAVSLDSNKGAKEKEKPSEVLKESNVQVIPDAIKGMDIPSKVSIPSAVKNESVPVKESVEHPKGTCWLGKSVQPHEWVFVDDGYRTASVPGMKMHVKSAFGPEVVESIKWVKE